MVQVSIDMSKDDETYQNRIFGEVIDIQDNILICEYIGANYDFDNVKTINKQQAEINRLREVIRLARDTAYQATQDCPRCGFIDDVLTKALKGESEGK